jgi:hypothetical protein
MGMEINDALSQHTQTGQMPTTVGQLSPDNFMKFVDETRNQPAFRSSMDKAADYYDGNQLTAETLKLLDQMGFSQLMTNLIKPAIDAVLGIEAKTRTDARVVADDEQHMDVAEALSAKLAEAERESRADWACSDAYAGQCKAGLGWVHVARNSDPFLYKYRAESVHRREMFWDWSCPVSDPALRTARYVIRQKWFPVDLVTAAMPQHAPLINASASGWQPDWMQRARENTTLMNAFDQESRISVSAWDWRNIDNRRVCLQECWYATHVRGLVLYLGDRVVEFDKNNRLHQAAVQSGQFTPQPAVYRKLRCSIWFGPHLLQDYDPGNNELPYVPFWGFREDLTGVPYGLIRSMIPLQDEVNARRRKLMWLLSSKRVQIDSDALDMRYNDFSQLVDEISRPDSLTILNPGRTNAQAMKVESDLGLSQQQFEVLNEAKQGIQDAAGIFNAVMGKQDTGVTAGIAINSLVEQSSNTLGELNDNFKFARQEVMARLLTMIRQDLSGRPVDVTAGPKDARRKVISLNKPAVDEITGIQYFENDVDKAAVKVALEEIPSTPAYRQQQQMMMGEVLKSLPPQAQAVLMPFFIEGTDLPKRHQMADLVRKTMGLPTDGETDPQVAQLQQQMQALQQQSEQMAQQYEQAVQEKSAEAAQLQQQVQSLQLELKNKAGEIAVRQQELQLKAAETSAAAQQRQQEVQTKQSEQQVQAAQIDLKRQELALQAAKNAADHEHRQAELEHKQLSAAQSHGLAQQQPTPEDEMEHEQQLQGIKTAGAVTQAIEVAKIKAESAIAVAELRATGAPSTLTPEQSEAAEEAVENAGSDPLEPAPEQAKQGGSFQKSESYQ